MKEDFQGTMMNNLRGLWQKQIIHILEQQLHFMSKTEKLLKYAKDPKGVLNQKESFRIFL